MDDCGRVPLSLSVCLSVCPAVPRLSFVFPVSQTPSRGVGERVSAGVGVVPGGGNFLSRAGGVGWHEGAGECFEAQVDE